MADRGEGMKKAYFNPYVGDALEIMGKMLEKNIDLEIEVDENIKSEFVVLRECKNAPTVKGIKE